MTAERLLEMQQALLRTLFDPPSAMDGEADFPMFTRGRGLKAYQANAHMLAERALQSSYPVMAQMLGDDSFGELARALWHAHPPKRGDMAQWGDALAGFVQADPQLQPEPYLADVARCEWALHRAGFAADAQPEPATLSLLTTDDPQNLYLELAPGTVCIRSAWPVAALLGAHLNAEPSLAQAAELVREGAAQSVVVWRQGFRSRWRETIPGESDLLAAVLGGRNLLAAVEAAAPALDFARWLPLAVESGLLVRVVAHWELS